MRRAWAGKAGKLSNQAATLAGPGATAGTAAAAGSTATSRSTLLATSFVNPDGRLATVVMNPTDKAIAYNFYVGQASAVVAIPARAIQTLVN